MTETEANGEGEAPKEKEGTFVEAERRHRLEKLERMRERGVEPYPPRYDRDHTVAEALDSIAGLGPDQHGSGELRVAGRLILIRRHGGLIFADLRDRSGQIQLLAGRRVLGEGSHRSFAELDLGDWVGASGTPMTTRTGEPSLEISSWELLSKSLRTLPSKGRGLTEVDTRFRQRYLDLIINESSRRIATIRSQTIASVRAELTDRGFMEVETPVLDASAGGAAARPFITHHNALDIDMYLRIALELPLKRLVVGGLERVFEIGRVFRNEGLDTRHNPEFTLLEAYQAFADYHDMMDLVESIVARCASEAIGTTVVEVGGREIDLAPPWRRAPMAELIAEHAGVEMHPSMPIADARAIASEHGIAVESGWGAGRLMSEVYDATCEEALIDPTFVCDHPREISPLAKAHRDDPVLTERFEAVIAGRELANAYSELNDPVDQRARFEREAKAKAAGDAEAEDLDEDYIRALEYGLPPTGGLGIGLDRLAMLLAGVSSIREVILFPTMRPAEGAGRPRPGLAAAGRLPRPEAMAPEGEGDEAERSDRQPGAAERTPAVAITPATQESRFATAVRWIAILTAAAGVVSLLPTLPVFRESFSIEPWLARSTRAASYAVSVAVGIGMLFMARQLARRKLSAWWVSLFLFATAIVIHLLKGPDPLATLFNVGMLAALIWWREAFTARGDPGSLLSAIRFVPVYLLSVLAFGTVSLLIAQDRVDPSLTPWGIVETSYGGLVGLDGPYTYRNHFFDDFFPTALLILGIAGLVVLAYLLFRPLIGRSRPSPEDRDLAHELVRNHGDDTLAYFALREDKSYFFADDGSAMIAYAYLRGYALGAGDPIGPREAIPRVLDEFLAFCRERAWHAAFLAVREEDLDLYRERGLHSVYLGDEAIIRCDRFTLSGSAMKPVRSAVHRVGRDHRFEIIRESEASASLVEELNEISRRWRGKAPERGFTMELGQEVKGRNPDFLLAIAFRRDDRPEGFLRLVPCYGHDPGYSLDLMRRNPDAANGMTEFLIANASLALGEGGFRRLSMNFAAWGRLFEERTDLSPGERVQRRIASALNPFFQIKSLRDFNEKFQPEWLPRSIIVEDPAAFAKVGILFASVEGFLNVPVVGGLLVPPIRSAGEAEAAPAAAAR